MSETTKAAGAAGVGSFFGSVVGVALTAFGQYFVGDMLETRKQRLQTQLTAYGDFAKAQAAWQRAGDASKKEEAEKDANLKIRDAAFRIAIFSPDDLVKSLSKYVAEKHRGNCANSAADIAVYQTMRAKAQAQDKSNVPDQDMAMVLFGCTFK